ncbi:metal-dependent hydrolase, beta-lactamase superfamily II [Opitutaceae bacterium TAV1]|nr:metal-dependent hydrolase, beta-lactamase superfamily II [Opitutaceae bacterium TAV1]
MNTSATTRHRHHPVPVMLKIVLALCSLAIAALPVTATEPATDARVRSLKITILSTMLADGRELGEWGFAALVEADGRRILFDTGAHPDLVLENARTLGIDLTTIPEIIITHNHWDHIGGLLTLRKAVLDKNAPDALSRVHVGEGVFYARPSDDGSEEENLLIAIKPAYEKTGGVFVVHDKPVQLHPGIWLTGPVPRKYPERNWGTTGKVVTPAGVVEDNIPEDQALVFDTDQGLVALFGCGHAGVVNTLDYARTLIRPARIHALIGGIHVFAASDKTWEWTAGKLAGYGVDHYIGAHCTGIESVYRFRANLGLDRKHAVVGAVGAGFTLGQGIDPRHIAR